MQVTVTFRHIEPTEGLQRYAKAKVERVRKYLRRPIEAHVTLSVEKQRHLAEVQVTANRLSATATEETGDLYSAIDLAMAKVERQIQKHVRRAQDRKTSPVVAPRQPRAPRRRPGPVRVERIAVKPMSIDEALVELQLSRRPCLLFTNASSEALNVLYRQDDGTYGLLEPEPS